MSSEVKNIGYANVGSTCTASPNQRMEVRQMDTPILSSATKKSKAKGGITGKGFVAGDPRINRDGRPRKFSNRKDSDLLRRYGIRLSDYEALLERQGGVCAICGQGETISQARYGTGGKKVASSLAVDHNHETGEVRGLICWKCNVGVVKLLDNRNLVEAAAKYLDIKIDYDTN